MYLINNALRPRELPRGKNSHGTKVTRRVLTLDKPAEQDLEWLRDATNATDSAILRTAMTTYRRILQRSTELEAKS